ncbi:hypothetical protein [Coxiella-like endosymbiont]|uniref:hypothetical protein n=1 Tax=Coxiella-like endosymbiont TaxID=1592897 RepID=UPI00272D7561|nr:hypothetical protein [Coxiella-like endosymbiont]
MITTLIILEEGSQRGCHQKEVKDTIRVGTISGPETELMETVKEVILNQRSSIKTVWFTCHYRHIF